MNIFIVHVPIHYYLFRSIYKNLSDSYFIVPPMSDKQMSDKYGSGMSGKGLYNFLFQFLEDRGCNILDYGELKRNNFIKFLSSKVDNIICPHQFDGIYEIDDVRIFKMVYGIPNNMGIDQFSYSQNFISDLIFTFGPETVGRFKQRHLNASAVGNPLFDFWFLDDFDIVSFELIKGKLKKEAPTILYLPTHNYYSSIDQFGNKVIELAQKYNVIVKLHHMTFNGEANRLCKFVSHPEIVTLGDFFDPLVLYKVADIVITDVSGALFDALLANKPIIMLGNSFRKYKVDILTQGKKDAPIEDSGIFPYTEDPEELDKLIQESVNKPISLKEEVMEELFYIRDGQAGKRIADAILDEKKYPLVPTLEKYEKAIKNAPGEEARKDIIDKKDYFVRKYCQSPPKKPSFVDRIIKAIKIQ